MILESNEHLIETALENATQEQPTNKNVINLKFLSN